MDNNIINIIIFVLVIITLAILLRVNTAMADIMKKIAEQKGYDSKLLHIFAWCFWMPFFGCIYVIALPDLNQKKQNDEIIKLLSDNFKKEEV